MVFATSTGVTQLSVEYCHLIIVPVLPERVSVVVLVPEQTVAEPAMLPPTETGSTVICTTSDSTAPDQPAMQSTLAKRLYQVVAVNPAGGS